ncbi:GIY-YIG nuclease family protein [Malonomonas rubra]|uniref:GIY-YIG nuclease family protein n=1 Tax=Malonomonas rubra TaxID=57040 RepID=UPI0026EA7A5B|nr:GIY-YIG nuclease family protein [Malonomonas rubra]
MEYCVYIMANAPRGTLYVGMTSNIVKRTFQHKTKVIDGFTARHGLTELAYFEVFSDVREAIKRERQIKKWNRIWKIELIENSNPNWIDLYVNIH